MSVHVTTGVIEVNPLAGVPSVIVIPPPGPLTCISTKVGNMSVKTTLPGSSAAAPSLLSTILYPTIAPGRLNWLAPPEMKSVITLLALAILTATVKGVKFAELFAATGSLVVADTVTVLVYGPAALTVTVTASVAIEPGANAPMVQSGAAKLVPEDAAEDTSVYPAGSTSTALTPRATEGPALVTSKLKTMVEPTAAVLLVVFVTPTLAEVVMLLISDALLFAPTGSKTPAAMGSIVTVFVMLVRTLAGSTRAVTVNVATPNGAKVMAVAIAPVPLAS